MNATERKAFRRLANRRARQSANYRLTRIAEIIEAVDSRCMAADGPVTPTRKEITDDELRRIYALASGKSVK